MRWQWGAPLASDPRAPAVRAPAWFLQWLWEHFKEKAGKGPGSLPLTCCPSVLAGGVQGAWLGSWCFPSPGLPEPPWLLGHHGSRGWTGAGCQAAALPAQLPTLHIPAQVA